MYAVTTKKLSESPRMGLIEQWKEDIGCVFARDPAARSHIEILLTYPGVHAVLSHRIANRLWLANWKLSARFISSLTRLFTNVDIHPGATIGRRFFIDHGACVVVGETCEIGNDVTIYHGVTLGGTSWNKAKRHPTLGNEVLIGAGAKVLGPITLGDKVRVGANSVVIKDVPPCCTVVGIPGRIVQRKGLQIDNNMGINLDHHMIPDPVGKAISCLIERLDYLENKLEIHEAQKNSDEKQEHCEDCDADAVCHSHSTDTSKPEDKNERKAMGS